MQGNIARQTVQLEDEVTVLAGAHYLRLRSLYGAGRLSAELEVQVLTLERAMALPALDAADRLMMSGSGPTVAPLPVTPATSAEIAAWTLTWHERGLVWPPAGAELALTVAAPYTLVWNDQSLVWPSTDGELSMESVE